MTTTATLEMPQVSVDPGTTVVVPLSIRNHGTLVEGYRFEIVGIPAQWASVDPPEVSLYPGDAATARVTLRPPRDSGVPAGELAYGVRVVPTERPNETVVPEGTVVVLPFLQTTAELIPRTSRGRRGAKHQIAADNRGNVPVTLVFDGFSPGEKLNIDIDPGVAVGPGSAAFVDLRVRSRKRLWRGTPITHPFVVNVTPHDGPPVVLDGAHLQEPVFPKWLLKALIALIALAAILAALWFLVLKPAVKSAAKDAANAAIKGPVASASKQAAAAQQAAAAAGKGGGTPVTTTTTSAAPRPGTISSPVEQRLDVVTSQGANGSSSYVVPKKGTAEITDIVMENPQGDFGSLTISFGGSEKFVLALENFRDIDYHFVSPLVATGGQSVTAAVHCAKVGQPVGSTPTSCNTSVLLGGTLSKPAR